MNGTTFFITIFNILSKDSPSSDTTSFMRCHGQEDVFVQIVRATLFNKNCISGGNCSPFERNNLLELYSEKDRLIEELNLNETKLAHCFGKFSSHNPSLLDYTICPWLKDAPSPNFIYDCVKYAAGRVHQICTNVLKPNLEYCYDITSDTATTVSIKFPTIQNNNCNPVEHSIIQKILNVTTDTTQNLVNHFSQSATLQQRDSNTVFNCNDHTIIQSSSSENSDNWRIIAIAISSFALVLFTVTIYFVYRKCIVKKISKRIYEIK